MYKIYADGETIHNPALNDDTHLVVDAKISQKVNMADALEFTIYPNNAGAASIHKLTTTIEVYQDELLLFRGRPIQSKTGWENQVTYTCEGGLAVLNDTIVRPYSFTGSVRDYLQQLITQHNNQVPAAKQITLRNVTVTDPNNTIVRSNQDYVTTMQEIQDKLVENLGGYLVLSYDAQTGWILDYLAASPRATGQAITLAKNLLDILREQNAENIATALIPLGAVDEETGERITIRTVNGGQDYIVDQTAAARYGLIFTTETWDDVTLPANLLRKALERLTDYATMIPTIKLTAVDLSAIDPDLDPIRILDEVTVQDDKHEASGVYLVAERTYDLSAPERDTVTFGGDLPSITKASAKTAAEVQDIPAQILQTASDRTRAILDAATEGAIQILYNENGVAYELRINNSQNPATATKWWRYNSAGWGYTDDGGQTYTIAATMDGAILASLITTGILKSDDGKTFFLDLDNGILRGNFETLTIEGKTVDQVADQVAGGVLDSFVDGTYAAFVTSTNNGITAALDAASGAASAASSAQAAASSASAAAANAQATADKKITTYYQTLAPTTHNLGDLWIDTDDSNKLYRWNGSSWVNVRDTGIQSALTAAANAQTTADGKIMTYAQASAPSGADLDVGDLWIDTDDNNRMYRWSGTRWVAYTDSSAVVEYDTSLNQLAVFNKLTNNGQTQGIYLSDGKIYVNASYIKTGTLTAIAINNGNGTFSVDKDGNVTANSLSSNNATITGGSVKINTSSSSLDVIELNYTLSTGTGGWKNRLSASSLRTSLFNASGNESMATAVVPGGVAVSSFGIIVGNMNTSGLYHHSTSDGRCVRIKYDVLEFYDASGSVTARYSANQTLIYNTGTVPIGSATITASFTDSIYNFNAVVIVFQVSSYKATLYLPKIEYGTGWMDVPLIYSDSWKAYLDIRFVTGTSVEYTIRGIVGWDQDATRRLTIYGVS